jgi:hypothetical protein
MPTNYCEIVTDMKPIVFEGYELILGAPKDWDASVNGPCLGLPIARDNGCCVSVWDLSWRERLAVLFGGRIAVWVHSGRTQPPIALGVTTVEKA